MCEVGCFPLGLRFLVCECFFSTEEQKNILSLAGSLMMLMYLCLVSFFTLAFGR